MNGERGLIELRSQRSLHEGAAATFKAVVRHCNDTLPPHLLNDPDLAWILQGFLAQGEAEEQKAVACQNEMEEVVQELEHAWAEMSEI